MPEMTRACAALALAVAVSAAGTAGLAAQQPPEEQVGWSVEPRASADLWFHGLAVIGYEEGGGPFPLYDTAYARRVREAKEQAGVYPTPLDSAAEEMREAFHSEPRLQIAHFVPLYFARAGPQEMLAALSAVADNRARDSAIAGFDVRFGALAMARTLSRGSERRVLKRFVELLQAEWDTFYSGYWDVFWRERLQVIREAQRLWARDLEVPLERYLRRMHLEHGMIIPVAALGFEGRLDEGDQFDPRDNVVAVRLPPTAAGPLPLLYGVVRELCFPLLDEAIAVDAGDLEEAERLRSVAAVRCGAVMLEFYAPAHVLAYRRWFLDIAGEDGAAATAAAFQEAYPMRDADVQGLRAAMRRP